LPSLFNMILGKSMRAERIAMLDAGGVGSATKARAILNAMGLSSKIVVDLDFAFRGAIEEEWLALNCPEITKCREMLAMLAPIHGGALDAGGLPTKGVSLSASELFAVLATHEPAKPQIQILHETLLVQNVWLWTLGTVEKHLNIGAKNEAAWSTFLAEAATDGWETRVPNGAALRQFMDWLAT
jgi:putative ATP-dependent endonuclease of the OLD family